MQSNKLRGTLPHATSSQYQGINNFGGSMHKYLILVLFTILTGCASSTGIYTLKANQSQCEQQSDEFLTIFECTKAQLKTLQQNKQDAQVTQSAELYLLKGEQLKEKVLNDEMTNLDAKYEWQKLYVELDDKIRAFQQRAMIRNRFGMRYGCMWPTRFGCW